MTTVKSLTAMFIVCLFIAGCGSPTIVGSWVMDIPEMAQQLRQKHGTPESRTAEDMGIPYQKLVINSDGTFARHNYGRWTGEAPDEPRSVNEGTYTINNAVTPPAIIFTDSSSERETEATYRVEGNKLVLTMEIFDGDTMDMIYTQE